jgi:two-component system OmpR family response regulator
MEALRVLIVDDEQELVGALVERLDLRGIDAEGVGSGAAALELIAKQNFDVVLLDLKMPGMDGLETLQRIKAANPACEVILLTGLPTVATVIQGLKEGAFDYVVKPQDIELLVRKIREAFQKARSKAEEVRGQKVEKILDGNND